MKRYKCYYKRYNGLIYVQKSNGKCGLLFSEEQRLPFIYYAISVFHNDYAFGLIETKNKEGETLYNCQIIKARYQLNRSDSIFPLERLLFTNKTKEEVDEYFANKEELTMDCASYMSDGYYVNVKNLFLQFFPFDTLNDWDENNKDDSEEDFDRVGGMVKRFYDPWEHYSHEESLYDALGGEIEAIWNID